MQIPEKMYSSSCRVSKKVTVTQILISSHSCEMIPKKYKWNVDTRSTQDKNGFCGYKYPATNADEPELT